MRRTKEQKGITLIALIITIVVLLILAAVAISSITNDGIIDKAQGAVNEYEVAQEKEKLQMAALERFLISSTGNLTLENHLAEIYGEENVQLNADNSVTVTMPSGNKYTVTESGDTILLDGSVQEPEAAIISVSLDKTEITKEINHGETATESITATLNNASGTLTWLSSDTDVAEIITTEGNTRTIEVKKAGTAIITVKYAENTSIGAVCTINVIEKTGHTYENGVCTICGETCEHSYGSWTTVKEATCEETGTQQKTCSICGNKETQSISAIGHSYSESSRVASTCTTAGKVTYTCSGCGDTYNETLELLSHTVVTDAAVSATCTTSGLTAGSHCSVCNTVLTAQQTVPATGHQNTTIINASASYTGDTYCNDCKTTIATGEEITATVTITVVDGDGSYAWLEINGSEYYEDQTLALPVGTVITCRIYSKEQGSTSFMYLNGEEVCRCTVNDYMSANGRYEYTVTKNCTIELTDYSKYGRMYITEQ